jgi:hypothetical protein
MSKKYLNIGEHGLNGDFYFCEDGQAFRADNLAIATKIAFNNWLHDFNPLYRECTLVSITDGLFTVSIADDGEPSRMEMHSVAYYGPGDMFTAEYIHQHAEQWHAERYAEMERMLTAGDPRVRCSNRSGLVIFAIHFPRYDKNGEWWSGENTYLSDDKPLADQQWEYMLADDKTSLEICERNFQAYKILTQKQMEVCHD